MRTKRRRSEIYTFPTGCGCIAGNVMVVYPVGKVWLVHRIYQARSGWSVTHRPTGLLVCHCDTEESAINLARYLHSVSRKHPRIWSRANKAAILKAIEPAIKERIVRRIREAIA